MEIRILGRACAAISVHMKIDSPRAAAGLVRSALRSCGAEPWPRMELELFECGGGTLILARPAPELRVEVADYALPFLGEGV